MSFPLIAAVSTYKGQYLSSFRSYGYLVLCSGYLEKAYFMMKAIKFIRYLEHRMLSIKKIISIVAIYVFL